MPGVLTLYFRLIGARIRAQMQYKLSFALDMGSFALLTWVEFAATLVLLQRFGSLGGWTVPEIAMLYGFSSIAFSLAEMIGRGFDAPFERMIQQGAFDGVLTRPLGSFFQVLASEFQLRRLGRTFQAMAVLAYAFSQLPISWTPAKLALVPLTIASGATIFTGLAVIGATMCFWTVKTPEVINVFTAGGYQIGGYPQHIFNRWIRSVFLFVVPVTFASYPTGLVLLDRRDPSGLPAEIAWAAPLVAALFRGVASPFWRVGVTKYTSTGS
jgi:ABC-2 type transport system permease protein